MSDFSSCKVCLVSLEDWHKFASGFEDRHVFHHSGWIKSLLDTYHFPLRIYSVKDGITGEILAALPFMRVITLGGRAKWVCLPFTDYFPVLGDVDLTVGMVKHLHAKGILKGVIEVRFELPKDQDFHYSVHQVSHSLDLRVGNDPLFEAIDKNHRKALRQGKHRGLGINFSTSMEAMQQYYYLQLRTRHAKGLPTQPWRFFKHIHQNLIADGTNGFITLAKNRFVCIGGKVVLHWGKVMTGKFSASDYAFLSFRPNHGVYWGSMQWGIDHGFQVYDLGKTSMDNVGLCRFKNGWNAKEKPLRYTYLGINQDVEVREPTDTGVIALMSRIIKSSPLFVSRLLGEFFYRYFA